MYCGEQLLQMKWNSGMQGKGSAGSGTYRFKMKEGRDAVPVLSNHCPPTQCSSSLRALESTSTYPYPIFDHHITMSRTLNQQLTQFALNSIDICTASMGNNGSCVSHKPCFRHCGRCPLHILQRWNSRHRTL